MVNSKTKNGSCSVFNFIKDAALYLKDDMNAGQESAAVAFNLLFSRWYKAEQDSIKKCASTLPAPAPSDLIGYERNVLFGGQGDGFITFVHRMKSGGYPAPQPRK